MTNHNAVPVNTKRRDHDLCPPSLSSKDHLSYTSTANIGQLIFSVP